MWLLVMGVCVFIYCMFHQAFWVWIDDCIAERYQKDLTLLDIIYRGMRVVGTPLFLLSFRYGLGLWIWAWVFKRIVLAIFYNKNEWRSTFHYY